MLYCCCSDGTERVVLPVPAAQLRRLRLPEVRAGRRVDVRRPHGAAHSGLPRQRAPQEGGRTMHGRVTDN